MDQAAFRAALQAEGFTEVLDRRVPPAPLAHDHTHDFDVRIQVLEGEFILRSPAGTHHHGPGAIFEVPAGMPHAEGFGANGAAYIAGRRHPR